MAEEREASRVFETPRIALGGLLEANENLVNAARGEHATAAATISSAASLLMIAELFERLVSEAHEVVVELHRLRTLLGGGAQ
jgi:hypothetical protein